jgi:nucleoside 2-deoxyribosyltransferase
MTPRIYLAGPAVFRPDAIAYGQWLKDQCIAAGFEGLYPLDNAVPEDIVDPAEQGAWVYRANLRLIEQCDLVLADLNFFRGAEPDSGTCFEVGYAVAQGKPVYAHVQETGNYAERIAHRFPDLLSGNGKDRDGMVIEEFELPLNLMLAVPTRLIQGSVADALALIADEYRAMNAGDTDDHA